MIFENSYHILKITVTFRNAHPWRSQTFLQPLQRMQEIFGTDVVLFLSLLYNIGTFSTIAYLTLFGVDICYSIIDYSS